MEVNVVNVEVYATDKDGNRVAGLKKEDFAVFEDGKPVAITNFEVVTGRQRMPRTAEPPIPSPGGPAPPAAERPAARPAASSPEDAWNLIVFFDNSNLRAASRSRALGQLRQFLDSQLAPGDRVMLVSYDLGLRIRLPFTSDLKAVDKAIGELGKLAARGPEADRTRRHAFETTMKIQEDSLQGPDPLPCPQSIAMPAHSYADSRRHELLDTLRALTLLVNSLSGVPGRKAVLHVSDGLPITPGEELFQFLVEICGGGGTSGITGHTIMPGGGTGQEGDAQIVFDSRNIGPQAYQAASQAPMDAQRYKLTKELQALTAHANAHRVTLYTLQPGLAAPDASDASFAPNERIFQFPAIGATLRASNRESLQLLADETGGRAILDANQFQPDLTRMREDSETFYSLGYTPAHSGDGREHRIEVKVKRPGVRLRHRQSYRDKPVLEKTVDRTLAALLHGFEDNPLEIAVELGEQTPGPAGNFNVPVRLRIPLFKLAILNRETVFEGSLRLLVATRDGDGRSSPVRQISVPLQIPRKNVLTAMGQFYVYTLTLQLPAGEQHVAVAVRDELAATTSYLTRAVSVGTVRPRRAPGPDPNPERGYDMKLRPFAILLLLASASVLAAKPPAAPAPRAFGEAVEVNVVNVDVYATDKSGNRVTDLRKGDFQLFEDGKPVEISNFEAVNGRPGPAAPGSPAPAASSPEDGWNLIVFFDNFNVNPSSRARAVRQLRQFLARELVPSDRVTLVTQDFSLNIRLPFTGDQAALSRALDQIDHLSVHGPEIDRQRKHAVDLMVATQQNGRLDPTPQPCPLNIAVPAHSFASARRQEVLRAIGGLTMMVNSLSGVPGRKAVLHVSDGLPLKPGEELFQFLIALCGGGTVYGSAEDPGMASTPVVSDTTMRRPPAAANVSPEPSQGALAAAASYEAAWQGPLDAESYSVAKELQALAAHANAQRVTLYTLQASGLQAPDASNAALGTEDRLFRFPAVGTSLRANNRDSLQLLADETGGRSILDTNDFLPDLGRLLQDFESYYSLGYTPGHSGDGREHRIEVKVARAGLRLRYRQKLPRQARPREDPGPHPGGPPVRLRGQPAAGHRRGGRAAPRPGRQLPRPHPPQDPPVEAGHPQPRHPLRGQPAAAGGHPRRGRPLVAGASGRGAAADSAQAGVERHGSVLRLHPDAATPAGRAAGRRGRAG